MDTTTLHVYENIDRKFYLDLITNAGGVTVLDLAHILEHDQWITVNEPNFPKYLSDAAYHLLSDVDWLCLSEQLITDWESGENL